MGDNNPFASAHLFENVLLGVVGVDGYKGLWTGKTKWDDPKVTEAIETMKKMLGYVNTDHAALNWDAANDYLIQGKAAMTVMGDWTNGDYTAKKFTDYGWVQPPGTKGVFNALSDTFALPKGAKNRDNALEWLKLAGSVEGQDAFNPLKGSIPVNTNAGKAEGYNDYLKATMEDWKSHTIVPSAVHGAAIKDGWSQAFVEAVNSFVGNQDVAAMQKALGAGCTDANI
jgi:glucose/mannose transport system substrate-binding protein